MRSSSEVTFLAQVFNSGKPLTIFPMSQAQRILFNGTTAVGVQVHSAGMDWTLSARKEVIVSAGWSHSPQLLMVSGVGPAETLQAHNITIVKDLPGVGQNLHDSCNIGAVTHNVTLNNIATTSSQAIQGYINNGTGPLTNSGGDLLSFEKLPAAYRAQYSNETRSRLAATWSSDWPELEFTASERGGPGNTVGGGLANIGMLMVATLSRGNVTISSASMQDPPVISTNWLLDPADQEVAVQAYKRAREIWSHVDARIKGPEFMPGEHVRTDAQLREYILANGYNRAIHHGSSTCMMGCAEETLAVVDAKGRVFGTRNLRVIDSSSFRFTPPGHTQAATYAHAEKLVAEVLKAV
nr:dehydrogenase pate [Quercus suber]